MNKENFLSILTSLKGKEVWDIRMSESLGSKFSFEIGERIKVDRDDRLLEGVYSLTVYCFYRIILNGRLIISTSKTEEKFSFLSKVLKELENSKIESIECSDLYDLKFSFDNRLTLEVICDLYSKSYQDTNWILRKGKKYIYVDNQNKLLEE